MNAQLIPPVSLAGKWRFQLERYDNGIDHSWYRKELPGTILLPGSIQSQDKGDLVTMETRWTGSIYDESIFSAPDYERYRQPGDIKLPCWLQPKTVFVGAVWYQRDIEIATAWRGKRVVLILERPHWETRVWLDDTELGLNTSLAAPHEYELPPDLTPGSHRLTIRVDNRQIIDVGVNSHSISDQTQGNWNGIIGRIQLHAMEWFRIDDLQIYPHLANKSATVRGYVRGGNGLVALRLQADVLGVGGRLPPVMIEVPGEGSFSIDYPLGENAEPWDEFHPTLYRITATLPNGVSRSAIFGLREISTQGTQFLINGRKAFFRGTLECCIFPKTGYPPTDEASWKRIIRIAKEHGLNHLRFHSWCPPEAAFVAADELGMYFQVECGSWPNQGATVGDGKPLDDWLYKEAGRILKAFGNHPSFLLMTPGNEPSGRNQAEYLGGWVRHWQTVDPRRLYTSASGWPELPENDYHVTPFPRIQGWGEELRSRINSQPPETVFDYRDFIGARSVPVISHEIGEWCVYPNFDEIPKYTGHLKPKNFEIFRTLLEEHRMGGLARQFLFASGKLQALCYKEEIESALRTPGMGGFQLLDLHDFPGQGTAPVGVLDAFWEPKGYISADEFRRFCGSTVLLARLKKRVFTREETLVADLIVSHFGVAPLENAVVEWNLLNAAGDILAEGVLPACNVALGGGVPLGSICIELNDVPAPCRCKLVVRFAGTGCENDWDIWVYPSVTGVSISSKITLAREFDERALSTLRQGGNVLLLLPPERVKNAAAKPVKLGFSSIFWNTSWTRRQAPTTLGILCDPAHPALATFPTENHSNWQWWYLVTHAAPMIMDELPLQLQPIVQVIDDWATARKLGLLFEATIGRGKLLVCSIDLVDGLDENPVARQFRSSLFAYMESECFHPSVELTAAQLQNLESALH